MGQIWAHIHSTLLSFQIWEFWGILLFPKLQLVCGADVEPHCGRAPEIRWSSPEPLLASWSCSKISKSQLNAFNYFSFVESYHKGNFIILFLWQVGHFFFIYICINLSTLLQNLRDSFVCIVKYMPAKTNWRVYIECSPNSLAATPRWKTKSGATSS